MKNILPVAEFDSSFKPTCIPTSGEEYLRLVQFEVSQTEEVVEKSVPASEKYKIKEDLKPRIEQNHRWLLELPLYFSQLKLKFTSLTDFLDIDFPHPNDERGWYHFLLEENSYKHKPSLKLVASLNQSHIISLLSYIPEWKQELTHEDCVWIFALLVALDRRLSSHEISVLRMLANKCISLREQRSELAVYYDIFIVIVVQLYGQYDLVEFMI